jgi:hypothetical protein
MANAVFTERRRERRRERRYLDIGGGGYETMRK